jgi:hypothetical protein
MSTTPLCILTPPGAFTGETCLLDANGIMQAVVGPISHSGSFPVKNNYGFNIGVNGFLDNGFAPIYVDPKLIVTGLETLTPRVVRSLALDVHHVSTAVSRSIEVSLFKFS